MISIHDIIAFIEYEIAFIEQEKSFQLVEYAEERRGRVATTTPTPDPARRVLQAGRPVEAAPLSHAQPVQPELVA